MSLHQHLRVISRDQKMLTQLRQRLPGSEIVSIAPESRYLQLRLTDAQGAQANVWLDIDSWLEKQEAQLSAIPWSDVPLNYLRRWLKSRQPQFFCAEQHWDVAQITLPSRSLAGLALMLPAEPCPLLCRDWPQAHREDTALAINCVADVPFGLHIVLGYSRGDLSALVDVAPGDLLRIEQIEPHLAVGQHRLYRLSYYPHQEVIVEEQFTEQEEIFSDEEVLSGWGSLSVEITFVLDGRTVTLAELDAIGPGSALALQPDAEQNLKIYLNKKLFARGELVALEDGSLAVEVNHVNPQTAGNTEQSDAE